MFGDLISGKRAIFRSEKRVLQPEEKKLRFRRKVIFFGLCLAIFLCSIPVFRDRYPSLLAKKEARRLATILMDSRVLAAKSRAPALIMTKNGYRRIIGNKNSSCKAIRSMVPEQILNFGHVSFRIYVENEKNNLVQVKEICFHPEKGVVVDTGELHDRRVFALLGMEQDFESKRFDRIHAVVIEQNGDLISLKNKF